MLVDIQKILDKPNIILEKIKNIDIDNSLIYIAGSLMEGFGNKTSDIDVYIICEKMPSQLLKKNNSNGEVMLNKSQFIVHNLIYEGMRYDFEYWNKEKFEEIILKLNNLNFKTEGYIERLSNEEFDLLHRLKYGHPLTNETEFKKIYEKINFNNLNFYKVIIQSEKYANCVEDLQGAIYSNDLGTAFFIARQLIEVVVDSYLAINGETNPSKKWLYRKMIRHQEKTGDKELLNKYIFFQTYPFNKTTVNNHVKEAMKYCQNLNIKIQKLLKEKQLN